ncbi:hypothetical protein PR048_022987 [Dryococelus australis]|uniref:Uncharacterized protein n=1 Tax=Dryococelus australis TaxID=614101 RepID=A0ABQ9GST0_9NEOP|nr:hypothetical protein PR048_022987 [Dryococelus australis]
MNMEWNRNEGGGKREITKKTRGLTASSGTIPTCENPVTRPGIESGSPWWEASRLTAQPTWPLRDFTNVYLTRLITKRGGAVVTHWTRIREDPGSIPGPVILISVFHGFPKSLGKSWNGFDCSPPAPAGTLPDFRKWTPDNDAVLQVASLNSSTWKNIPQSPVHQHVHDSSISSAPACTRFVNLQCTSMYTIPQSPVHQHVHDYSISSAPACTRLLNLQCTSMYMIPQTPVHQHVHDSSISSAPACTRFLKLQCTSMYMIPQSPVHQHVHDSSISSAPACTRLLNLQCTSMYMITQSPVHQHVHDYSISSAPVCETDSTPDEVASGIPHVGIVLNDAAGRRVFSGISRFPRHCIPTLLHTHLTYLSSDLKISMLRAAQISPLHSKCFRYEKAPSQLIFAPSPNLIHNCCSRTLITRYGLEDRQNICRIHVFQRSHDSIRVKRCEYETASEWKGEGKREIPEKTRRPAASSGTIPTCKNPEVTRPGIETGSPGWETSALTAHPPRPLEQRFVTAQLTRSLYSMFTLRSLGDDTLPWRGEVIKVAAWLRVFVCPRPGSDKGDRLRITLHCSPYTRRLTYSPPTKANRVQSPAGSLPDFRKWESCRTMLLVGGFSRGSPGSPTLSFRRCSILTSITLIGSQYIAGAVRIQKWNSQSSCTVNIVCRKSALGSNPTNGEYFTARNSQSDTRPSYRVSHSQLAYRYDRGETRSYWGGGGITGAVAVLTRRRHSALWEISELMTDVNGRMVLRTERGSEFFILFIQSQCSKVLQAPSRTVGFTRRFHALSSIHATNTSPAVVLQSPVDTKDCQPVGCGSIYSVRLPPRIFPNTADASRRAEASQSHQNILASSPNPPKPPAGEMGRGTGKAPSSATGRCSLFTGKGECEVDLLPRRGAAESAPAAARNIPCFSP